MRCLEPARRSALCICRALSFNRVLMVTSRRSSWYMVPLQLVLCDQASAAASGTAREEAEAAAAAVLERVFKKEDFRRMEVRHILHLVQLLGSTSAVHGGVRRPACVSACALCACFQPSWSVCHLLPW